MPLPLYETLVCMYVCLSAQMCHHSFERTSVTRPPLTFMSHEMESFFSPICISRGASPSGWILSIQCMCVYMYVCMHNMYVSTHVCMNVCVCMCVFVCTHVYVYMYVCMYECMCEYICMCVHVCTYVCMNVCMYVRVSMCVYV